MDEIDRLTLLLEQSRRERGVRTPREEVTFLLDHYRPRVEWREEPAEDFGLVGLPRTIVLTGSVRMGGQLFSYMGRIPTREIERHREPLKRHIRVRLGKEIMEYFDPDTPEGP